jgi:hypothetical protein
MPQAAITAVIELRIENTHKLLNATHHDWDITQLISSISSYYSRAAKSHELRPRVTNGTAPNLKSSTAALRVLPVPRIASTARNNNWDYT